MAAYVIIDIETSDPELMAQYRDAARPVVEAHGGRYVVRGGATMSLEGGWDPQRIVILEFPSVERAKAWWGSDDYAPVKALRQRAGTTRMVIVEGFDG